MEQQSRSEGCNHPTSQVRRESYAGQTPSLRFLSTLATGLWLGGQVDGRKVEGKVHLTSPTDARSGLAEVSG